MSREIAEPIHALSASALASRIRQGALTATVVVEATLARIAAVNGRVNALTTVLTERALREAEAADRARREGAPLGPLHGVPFTVKENLDCLGTATTHGVRALANALPYRDAPVVERLRAAGAIPIGRGNLSELGMRLCADNPLRGATRNPWDARVTPGGSSGGDAVAVALGMAPIGIGSDIGGSLRVPAHCCGVATLKPTSGRVPFASSLPPHDFGMSGQAMLAVGPICRRVEDLRLCLSVIAGRDVRDPRSVDAPLRGPAPEERSAAVVFDDASAAQSEAMRRAVGALEDAGWSVEEVEPPEVARVGELWLKLLATDLRAVLPLSRPLLTPSLYEYVMRICERARVDEVSNNRLHEERSRLQREWSSFLQAYPILITPNLSGGPWPVDEDLHPTRGLPMLERATRYIVPANALGLPALALPIGVHDGLPLGLQIYADLWREDLCLEAASSIETAFGSATPPW